MRLNLRLQRFDLRFAFFFFRIADFENQLADPVKHLIKFPARFSDLVLERTLEPGAQVLLLHP
ncbi:hypothetical protein D3C73_1439540 [compost metagenome]